jgi:leucyl/phenylalanyl-tRNA--protein transferase
MTFPRLFPGGPFLLGDAPTFPDPEATDAEGLLAVGGDLSQPRLLAAYRAGIFPWFSKGEPILWWCPPQRACLPPGEAHVSRTLARVIRQGRFEVREDTAFAQVVRACAKAPRRGQRGTWITPEMQAAYTVLHHQGCAHSVEAWSEDTLVGGLYGIALGGAFFGESMFTLAPEASKVCFAHLANRLHGWGFTLLDCQVENPHTTSLGAQVLPRADFLTRLAEALQLPDRWGGDPLPEALDPRVN